MRAAMRCCTSNTVCAAVGIEAVVQLQVEQREEQLAQHVRARAVGARGAQLLEQRIRQRRAGLEVAREAEQGLAVIAPVLHELAGQLDRVPLDVADARGQPVVDPGQHVLQAVAELVEERLDLVERHQRRLVADRRRLVADQVRDRQARAAARVGEEAAPAETLVHPGAAALLGGPRVGIEVERRERLAPVVVDAEEAHVGVPDRRLAVGRADPDAEQPLGQREQARRARAGSGKYGRSSSSRVRVALLAQALGPERDVPVRELARSRRARARTRAAPRARAPPPRTRRRAAPRAAARTAPTSGAIFEARLSSAKVAKPSRRASSRRRRRMFAISAVLSCSPALARATFAR